jgi:hypothetical protein
MMSAWDITKKRSNYHFDHTQFDPEQDRVIVLGSFITLLGKRSRKDCS